MTLQEYQRIFENNLQVMSRTASGVLDLSASRTKKDSMLVSDGNKAKELVNADTHRAVAFLYENRERHFESARELGDFLLELAKIVNTGIIKDGMLFRSGEDSVQYNYTRIKDLPAAWDWFIKTLFWMIDTDAYEAYEVAAICELVINSRAHFFSDGCGKISMLTALYIFMRHDLPGVRYISRTEYYRVLDSNKIANPSYLVHMFMDMGAYNFLRYYGSLCRTEDAAFSIYYEESATNEYMFRLNGSVTKENVSSLKESITVFYLSHEDTNVIFECGKLSFLCSDGAKYFARLKTEGNNISFINVGYECKISLIIENLISCIPFVRNPDVIDVSGCKVLGEGANGRIYRINDELIAKTYKKDGYYDDMMKERQLLRDALVLGIPAPISFGYAIIDGSVALLMELVHSDSLLEIVKSENSLSQDLVEQYVAMVKQLHETDYRANPSLLPYGIFEQSVLKKADALDPVIRPKYRGVARKLLEAIDEPDTVIHGDIHPGNVMFSENTMFFIDFDSLCIDKPIYDLAALYQALFQDYLITDSTDATLLKLPENKARDFWNSVISKIYQGESPETVEKKLKYMKLISIIRFTHIMKKGNRGEAVIRKCIKSFEQCIEDLVPDSADAEVQD